MTCARFRDVMVAGARGELLPLARQHLESHLARCERCRAAGTALRLGLEAARELEPTVPVESLRCLDARLAPELAANASRRRWRVAGVLVPAALTASVAVLVLLFGGARPAPSLVELTPTPFVKISADADWGGVVTRDGRRVVVEMTKGTASFAFTGGEGRELLVRTPEGEARAVGTRFTVSVVLGLGMSVAVTEGAVQISSGGREVLARAGTTHSTFGGASREVDHYDFREAEATGALEVARPTPKKAPARLVASEPPDITSELERAEALLASGAEDAALAIYERCQHTPGLARAYIDLCAYESARIYGFVLHARARALPLFARLAASGEGEARWQAKLALCELLRADDPCGGARCATALARDASLDPTVRREASRLAQSLMRGELCEEAP